MHDRPGNFLFKYPGRLFAATLWIWQDRCRLRARGRATLIFWLGIRSGSFIALLDFILSARAPCTIEIVCGVACRLLRWFVVDALPGPVPAATPGKWTSKPHEALSGAHFWWGVRIIKQPGADVAVLRQSQDWLLETQNIGDPATFITPIPFPSSVDR